MLSHTHIPHVRVHAHRRVKTHTHTQRDTCPRTSLRTHAYAQTRAQLKTCAHSSTHTHHSLIACGLFRALSPMFLATPAPDIYEYIIRYIYIYSRWLYTHNIYAALHSVTLLGMSPLAISSRQSTLPLIAATCCHPQLSPHTYSCAHLHIHDRNSNFQASPLFGTIGSILQPSPVPFGTLFCCRCHNGRPCSSRLLRRCLRLSFRLSFSALI